MQTGLAAYLPKNKYSWFFLCGALLLTLAFRFPGQSTYDVPAAENNYTIFMSDEGHPYERTGNITAINNVNIFKLKLDAGEWAYIKGTWYHTVVSTLLRLFGPQYARYNDTLEWYHHEVIFIKFLQIIFNLLMAWCLFHVGCRFFNDAVGISAAFVWAVMPAVIMYSHFLKEDCPFASLMMLIAVAAILNAAEKNTIKSFIYAGVLTGLAAATKYTGFALCLLIIIAALFRIEKNKPFAPQAKHILTVLAVAAGCVVAGFIIGTPSVVLHFKKWFGVFYWSLTQFSYAMPNAAEISPRLPWNATYLLNLALQPALYASLAAAFVAATAYFFITLKKRAKADASLALVVIWSALWILITAKDVNGVIRYLLAGFGAFALLISVLFFYNFQSANKTMKTSAAIIFSSVLLATSVYDAALLRVFTTREARMQTADWINANAHARASIGIVRLHLDQYSDVPPLNAQRFRIVNIPLYSETIPLPTLNKKSFDYIIVSDDILSLYHTQRDYSLVGQTNLRNKYIRAAAWVSELTASGDYALAAEFEIVPHVFGITFPISHKPPEWLLLMPKIYVFQKRT